jgi:N-acetylglucosamine-6-sulfatase
MRKIVALVASLALAVVGGFAVLVLSSGGSSSAASAQAAQKPNIVFIITDDMRYDDLKYMPKTRSLLQHKGMSFKNAFVSNPLCCPSRATIMRGQYAHNTGVWTNANVRSPSSGWRAFHRNGLEQDDVATRLDDAGYRTGLFGKYLNGYNARTYVPPGWDRWFVHWGGGKGGYFDYAVNDDGTIRHYGTKASDYETDVLSRQTQAFIGTSAAQGKPFFAYVATLAPHGPATPAPGDRHTHDGSKAPRPPSFNERDVSDKPPWIRKLPRLTTREIAHIDNRHEDRVESLQAVDDLVGKVVDKLRNTDQLNHTYIFFTSDNGFHLGEHRIAGSKTRPYEEDIHMPLLVRGPGIAAGSTTYKMALNTDYLPTFTDLAGTQTPSYVDGRSLRPVLKGSASGWRDAILLEAHKTPEGGSTPAYSGIRTTGVERKYIEYADGKRELYTLGSDPYELNNKYRSSTLPASLASRLRALKSCAADTCRAAENGQH